MHIRTYHILAGSVCGSDNGQAGYYLSGCILGSMYIFGAIQMYLTLRHKCVASAIDGTGAEYHHLSSLFFIAPRQNGDHCA